MDDILNNAKLLAGISDSTYDDLLSLYVEMVVQSILNYCNRIELPDELRLAAAQMVADMYSQNNTSEGKTGGVSSVSEAGRTVSFNSSSIQTLIEYKLEERNVQLNGFRLPYRITDRM
ncbi:MAG: phage head-tail connector protein [Sporomusa sp.]